MDTPEHDPHRPQHLSDMAGAAEWARLAELLGRDAPPHVLLTGPTGTGKSCALRLALRGRTALWLRCSTDPNLRENRDRIKIAARRRVMDGSTHWVVLEHADALHVDAQAFLRRIIETNVGSTRFVLEVRDVAAIAEPLLSRMVMVTGPELLAHEVRAEVLRRAPGVSLEAATAIAADANGNVRWAVLQALGSGSGLVDPSVRLRGPPRTWAELLATLEAVQATGSSPRAWAASTSTVWERPGSADPWAIAARLRSPAP